MPIERLSEAPGKNQREARSRHALQQAKKNEIMNDVLARRGLQRAEQLLSLPAVAPPKHPALNREIEPIPWCRDGVQRRRILLEHLDDRSARRDRDVVTRAPGQHRA